MFIRIIVYFTITITNNLQRIYVETEHRQKSKR